MDMRISLIWVVLLLLAGPVGTAAGDLPQAPVAALMAALALVFTVRRRD